MKLFVWLLKDLGDDDYECQKEWINSGLVVVLARNEEEAKKALPQHVWLQCNKPEKVIDCERRHKKPFVAYATFAPLINVSQDCFDGGAG